MKKNKFLPTKDNVTLLNALDLSIHFLGKLYPMANSRKRILRQLSGLRNSVIRLTEQA